MPYAKRKRDPALQAVIDRVGIAELGHRLKPPQRRQLVYAWWQVPERWLAQVSKIARRSKHQLRPDLYARNGRRTSR